MWRQKFKIFQNLYLLSRCDLLCNDCQVWPKTETIDLKDLNIPEKAKIINICGGDPLYHPQLPELLKNLKEQKKYILVTTNGYNLQHLDKQIFSWIDLPVVYLPAFGKTNYLNETGLDVFAQIEQLGEYFAELKKKFIIHFPATVLNLEDLPEVFEFIKQNKQAYLWLNYQPDKHGVLSAESKKYIEYGKLKKKVIVYQATERRAVAPDNNICRGCNTDLETVSIKNILFWLSLFYKVYF